MGEIIYLPPPTELSAGQQDHWEQQLENAERAVEVAKRMLGLIPMEVGVPYGKITTDEDNQIS